MWSSIVEWKDWDSANYQVLEKDRLLEWDKQLVYCESQSLDTPIVTVFEYYHYLEKHHHFYGNMAIQNNEYFTSQLLKQYLDKFFGREITAKERRVLLIQLAKTDRQYRSQNNGYPLSPEVIRDYHYQVIAKQCRLDQMLWKESIFYKYPEMGFGLIGHIGSLGLSAQHNIPLRVSMFFIDAVIRRTIMDLPLLDWLYFLKDILSELKDIQYGQTTYTVLVLGVTLWMRDLWKNCFDLIHDAANQGIKIVNTNLEYDVRQLTTQLSASTTFTIEGCEHSLYDQVLGLFYGIILSVFLFKRYIPNLSLDLEKEARTAYIENYDEHLPHEIQHFILRICDDISSSPHSMYHLNVLCLEEQAIEQPSIAVSAEPSDTSLLDETSASFQLDTSSVNTRCRSI